VRDEVNLQVTGRRLVPVRKGAYRDLFTWFSGRLPLLPGERGAPNRDQQSVDGRRADREEALADHGVQVQMAVLFQGRDETGQDRLEALATDPIRGLPQNDEGFTHRLVVGPPSNGGGGRRRTSVGEQPDGMLAMAAGHGDEFVQDLRLLRLGSALIAL